MRHRNNTAHIIIIVLYHIGFWCLIGPKNLIYLFIDTKGDDWAKTSVFYKYLVIIRR